MWYREERECVSRRVRIEAPIERRKGIEIHILRNCFIIWLKFVQIQKGILVLVCITPSRVWLVAVNTPGELEEKTAGHPLPAPAT